MKVYDVETGEPMECHSVDANELIASGQYSMAAPQAESLQEEDPAESDFSEDAKAKGKK